jgi:hypothetical protein
MLFNMNIISVKSNKNDTVLGNTLDTDGRILAVMQKYGSAITPRTISVLLDLDRRLVIVRLHQMSKQKLIRCIGRKNTSFWCLVKVGK